MNSPYFVEIFVDETIRVEGGYVKDPSDSGGETNYGVTIGTARQYRGHWDEYNWDGNMNTMPREFAEDVYTYGYYYKPSFNLVAEKSEIIAKELFDTGVNVGTSRPSKWLQELLNVFNNQQMYYKDIRVDGIIGSKTASALQAFLTKRGVEGEKTLYNMLNALQGEFYFSLAKSRPKDEKYIWGWSVNRLDFKV